MTLPSRHEERGKEKKKGTFAGLRMPMSIQCQIDIEFIPARAPRADRLVMVLVLLRDGRPHSTLRCADPHRILWWASAPSLG